MKTLDFSFETKGVDETGVFEGYASVFGNVDGGGDIVEPGAFIESIVRSKKDGRIIPMLWQHDQREPIGIWSDIAEDSKGLYVKGQVLTESSELSRRAYALLKARAMSGLSIGYKVPAGGAEDDKARRGVRRLKKLDLFEVSIVTFPMNERARVTAVKAAEDMRAVFATGETPRLKLIEEYLRDGGFPDALATKFVSLGKEAFRRSDSGVEASEAERFLSALLKT